MLEDDEHEVIMELEMRKEKKELERDWKKLEKQTQKKGLRASLAVRPLMLWKTRLLKRRGKNKTEKKSMGQMSKKIIP